MLLEMNWAAMALTRHAALVLITPSTGFKNMGTIPLFHSHIHLPLFDWAERHRVLPPPTRLVRYRVNARLEVSPVWHEVRRG